MSHSDADSDNENNSAGRSDSLILPFDRMSLAYVILDICDEFGIRMMMPVGTPGTVCRSCYGIIGPDIGDHVSCECGIVAETSLREIWWNIEPRLTALYNTIYDHLVCLRLTSYTDVAEFFSEPETRTALAAVIVNKVANILSVNVFSVLPPEQ